MSKKITDFFTRDKRAGFLSQHEWIQLVLCLLIVGMHLLLLSTGRLDRAENSVLDYYFRQRPAIETHPDIVLIEIDEESLAQIGPLPWPRDYFNEMIEILNAWGASAIVFDVMFGAKGQFDSGELVRSLQQAGNVFLPVSLEDKMEKKFWVHSMPVVIEPERGGKEWVYSGSDLKAAARGIGHVNVDADLDGTVRRVKSFLADAGEIHPHLALPVSFYELNKPLPGPYDFDLPQDEDGNLLINWAGKWEESFSHYSYADLIRGYQATLKGQRSSFDPMLVKDKICLIGITAKGRAKLRATPIESEFPLFGIHANIINSILTERFVKPASFLVNAVCLMVIGLIASLLFLCFRNVPSFVAGLFLGVMWALVGFLIFSFQGIWLYVFHPILLIISLFIFSAIYSQVIMAKERNRLFDLATKDGLTGLYVIRHFREVLNQVAKEHLQTKKPLSIILIDIDNFKPVNDTYGHPAGDMVLKKTAETIFACLRSRRDLQEVDFVARYGGEEFIIMLRNADLKEASEVVAERVRVAIEKTTFRWNDVFIPVTASLGVSTLHFDETVPDAMVHRADEALYEAKRTGKNKVCKEKS